MEATVIWSVAIVVNAIALAMFINLKLKIKSNRLKVPSYTKKLPVIKYPNQLHCLIRQQEIINQVNEILKD